MNNRLKSLVGTIFAVLLVTSVITALNPTVKAANYRVKVLVDSRASYNFSPYGGPENILDDYGNQSTYFYREGMPGGTVVCRIFVTNTGDTTDTYTISKTETRSPTWATILPTSLVSVTPGETRIVTLTVSIPSSATIGLEDNIDITATGLFGAVNDNKVTIRAEYRLGPSNEDVMVRSAPDPTATDDNAKPESMYVGYYSTTLCNENAYLKFNLKGVRASSIPLSSARLFVYCYSGFPYDGDTGVYNLNWVENDNWDERTTTWINNPGDGHDNLIQQKHFQGIARAADNWLIWDITSIVNYELTHAANPAKGGIDNILTLTIRPDNAAYNGSLSLRTKQYFDYTKSPFIDVAGKGASVSLDPTNEKAFSGGKFYYTVKITNLNLAINNDNYHLSVKDDNGWSPKFVDTGTTTENVLNVPLNGSKTVQVYVTCPSGRSNLENADNVTVTALSYDNAAGSSDRVQASIVDNLLRPPIADSYVAQGYPDNNFGSRAYLDLQSYSENYKNERIFSKWSLAGLPPDNSITSAKLVWYCFSAYNDDIDAQVYSVSDDSWSENGITWNNQPAIGDFLSENTLSSYPNTVENTVFTWDVTSYVAGQHLTDNIASFCIKASIENTSGDYSFDSRETPVKWDNQAPYLLLTFGHPTTNIRKVAVSIADSATAPPAPIYAGPAHKIGDNNTTVDFTVKVMNMGNLKDTITLSSTDNSGWTRTFDTTSFSNVNPGAGATTTLHVAIPSGATPGTVDNIKVTATGTGVTDNEYCTVSVRKLNSWVVAGYSPSIDNYGTAVVGAQGYIYVANSNDQGTSVNFMRYDPSSGGSWTYLATPAISSPFKNGTVLVWDNSNYIYALSGGSYADNADNSRARHYFWRYTISTNTWDNLAGTGNNENENNNLGAQGPGDALAMRIGSDNIYAVTGNRKKGSYFWRYSISADTWTQIAETAWQNADDGCSLVWTGGDNLYLFPGENVGALPLNKNLFRYRISTNTWTKMTDVPDGIGDGASLAWTGGDNIYANTGGDPVSELARDNFYRYNISTNAWTKLENVPRGIGDPNGSRMGAVGGNIFLWRSACNPTGEMSPVLWVYTLNIPPAGASISFVPGWNLVCFTAVGAGDTPNTLFAPLTYFTDFIIYWWTAPGGPYSVQDGDTAFLDNIAYWVFINTNKTVKTTGTKPGSRTIFTVPGWNMVGFPVVNAGSTPNNKFAPESYFTDFIIYWWTAPGGPYSVQDGDTAFLENTGYWVFNTITKSVTVP